MFHCSAHPGATRPTAGVEASFAEIRAPDSCFTWLDSTPARDTGVIQSFLQPPDRAIPIVATSDVSKVAAELLQEQWHGHRVVELEGPRCVPPNDIAASFARLLNRSVRASAVARNTWEALFRSQGMKNPTPRIRMLDGFNEGWIGFERVTRKGLYGAKLRQVCDH